MSQWILIDLQAYQFTRVNKENNNLIFCSIERLKINKRLL